MKKKILNNLLSFLLWAILIGLSIILVFLVSNYGFFQHFVWLYFNPRETSFWAALNNGNWTKLIITAYSSAALVYLSLKFIGHHFFKNMTFLLKSALSVVFSIVSSFFSILAFSILLGRGHWREHCFGVCLLPPDEGKLILFTSCLVSALIYLLRLRYQERIIKKSTQSSTATSDIRL